MQLYSQHKIAENVRRWFYAALQERILPTILTPISLWKNFDDSLPLMELTTDVKNCDGITYETVKFLGRETGEGRVVIHSVFACSQENPSRDGVLIIPDSRSTIDENLLALFVNSGYSALMVDIRGEWENEKNYTIYPSAISYANRSMAGRHLDYVDESADKTCWYEWVAVGIYARKYLDRRLEGGRVGVVGIRDGGEVAWKLAYAGDFACAVPVCAGGWRAYYGYNKFGGEEPAFDEERHRFIAAIDSQSYAPYVKCPILMLCSTNDPAFDYDRAYDTFSRINPEFIGDSVIAYAIKSNACIGVKCVKDMFMFLDKFVKERQVFISKPAELAIGVDDESNLTAKVVLDGAGDVDEIGVYMAEDCKNPVLRDWMRARPKNQGDENREFYLDIYEKTSVLFAICYVTYSNGFTVWSKITVKKLSGAFRNSRPISRVIYSSRNGEDCFSLADCSARALSGIFFVTDEFFPRVIEREGLKGIYSPCGLSTYRPNSSLFAPDSRSMLRFDAYAAVDSSMELIMRSVYDGEEFATRINLVGGIWQNIVLESKLFKTSGGKTLSDFTAGLMFTIKCPAEYAVNNVMWL